MAETRSPLEAEHPPLLALLERVAGMVLQGALSAEGPLRLRGLELRRDGLTVNIEARRMTALVNGDYALRLRLEDTEPERSRCSWHVQEGRWAGRLAQWTLQALPERWLNGWLGRRVEGITVSGNQVLLEHRALVRWLLRRTATGPGR